MTFRELTEKYYSLERQKSQLIEDIKELRKKAEGKVLFLECEIAVLQEDAENLKKMI